jgi:hypothetical protein
MKRKLVRFLFPILAVASPSHAQIAAHSSCSYPFVGTSAMERTLATWHPKVGVVRFDPGSGDELAAVWVDQAGSSALNEGKAPTVFLAVEIRVSCGIAAIEMRSARIKSAPRSNDQASCLTLEMETYSPYVHKSQLRILKGATMSGTVAVGPCGSLREKFAVTWIDPISDNDFPKFFSDYATPNLPNEAKEMNDVLRMLRQVRQTFEQFERLNRLELYVD